MSGRLTYLVCYDIADPRRLRAVHRAMLGFGEHIQLSVFRCELDAAERVKMQARLESLVHHGEDQVLVVPVGPPDGRYASAWQAIGLPLAKRPRNAFIF